MGALERPPAIGPSRPKKRSPPPHPVGRSHRHSGQFARRVARRAYPGRLVKGRIGARPKSSVGPRRVPSGFVFGLEWPVQDFCRERLSTVLEIPRWIINPVPRRRVLPDACANQQNGLHRKAAKGVNGLSVSNASCFETVAAMGSRAGPAVENAPNTSAQSRSGLHSPPLASSITFSATI
jgi:hypothetical protein